MDDKMDSITENKIKVLLNEHQAMKNGILMRVKMIHNFLFIFIFNVCALFATIISKSQFDLIHYLPIVAFIISQIQVLIIVYTILITAEMLGDSMYLSYIESKVNSMLGEKLIFWEHVMAPKMRKISTLAYSTWILYGFYLTFFCILIYYSFEKYYYWCIFLQIFEVLIIVFLGIRLYNDHKRIIKFDPELVVS